MAIALAIEALRHFGAKDRETAAKLLSMWAHNDALTDEERELILKEFE